MKSLFRRGFAAMIAAGLYVGSLGAQAQSYPERPITIVVPHPPGGSVDGVARLFAEQLQDELGQSVLIENRVGASGMVGGAYVARAAPDGYTLYLNASIHNINPLLYKDQMKFDAVKDFAAVSLLARGALIFSIHPDVPATSLQELADLVRTDPPQYNFITTGFGSAGHLGISQFLRQYGLSNMPVILYNGGGPALQDLVGGQVTGVMDPMLSSRPFVQSGQLRALAVTGKTRSPLLPGVPTAQEAGMKDFEMYSWYGLWGPAGLPAEVVAKLEAVSQKIMHSRSMRQRLEGMGFESAYRNSVNFQRYINAEVAKYQQIIETAGIKIE